MTCADLLGRSVFYKVGHHGSHNATMNKGGLQEMARGKFSDQLVVMIPAHQKWAESVQPPWHHPLDAILKALHTKASGRVLVMDREPSRELVMDGELTRHGQELSEVDWKAFLAGSPRNDLCYELTVEDRSPG